jgi:hypothetical protein
VHPKIGLKKIATNKMRDNWTKAAQYLIKYKQKWERAVKKSDERDEERESDERDEERESDERDEERESDERDEERESDEEIKMQCKTVVCRFRYRIIRNRKCNIR